MLKIGITGGIGSGKTTVCRLFECYGVPVYYADERAKHLISNDPALRKSIRKYFGANAYHPDGSYNRPYMANIVFSDKEKLQLLNSLVHPAVARDGQAWLVKHSDAPYTLKEAALLFESGSYKDLDRIIFVSAPLELRVSRVVRRDETTREEVLKRIENQWPDEKKEKLSHEFIYNDGSQSLIRQVHEMHLHLLKLPRNDEKSTR